MSKRKFRFTLKIVLHIFLLSISILSISYSHRTRNYLYINDEEDIYFEELDEEELRYP